MIENNPFQSLFDVIPFGVYVSDAETREIVYMNVGMRERAGPGFGIGSRCWEAIYGQEGPCPFCRSTRLLDTNGLPNGRTEIFEHFDDSRDRWYRLQQKAMTWPDGHIVTYSIAVDITELKEIQNRLAEAHADLALKAREIQAAGRAKGAFLATMSHELRNPLNGILGFTQLLEAAPELGDQSRHHVGMIHQSGRHLLSLINDLLEMEKLEAGRLELQPSPFPPTLLLAGVVEMLGEQARGKGLELTLHTHPSLPERLLGDQRRINQVLLNLVGNAVKFTQRGRIVVEAAYRHGELQIAVTDHGPGIDPADQARLFTPFVQVGDPERRNEGSGLGLAICHQLVTQMGGRLQLESEPGRGSRFSFRIPLPVLAPQDNAAPPADATKGRGPSEGPPTPPGSLVALAGRRVLLVEDDAINQAVALGLLGAAGIETGLAVNGAEAIEAIRREHYDLVLMDIEMPLMDGYQATREIRKLADQGRLPIIALTAHCMVEERKQCLAAGMNDIITKPIYRTTLYDTLGRWLGAAAARSQEDSSAGASRFLTEHPQLLELFAGHYRGFTRNIRDTLAADDTATAFRLAHNLKSAAATIEAEHLREMATELERLLRRAPTDPEILPLIDQIDTELVRVLIDVESALSSS